MTSIGQHIAAKVEAFKKADTVDKYLLWIDSRMDQYIAEEVTRQMENLGVPTRQEFEQAVSPIKAVLVE